MSKALLVTGAARGIGRATALLAAARGWSVGVNYVSNATAAAETVSLIQGAGGQALAIQGDVADEAQVEAIFAATEAAFGPVQGLVINAGISGVISTVAEMEADRLRRVFDVNILGAFFCAREASRRMATSRGGPGGAIVIVSSKASEIGSAFEFVDYAACKGALDSLTYGLGRELAKEGVRVNAVRPGPVDTEIHASVGWPERGVVMGKDIPLGRHGEAEEIAEAICWLLSDKASYCTASILDVTGGR
ncbi:MAG: SDR family oxidoreductase [Magnetospiraceae bacterium]